MHSPLVIANYFVKKSLESGKELTPMKLVKLVYIAHGWHLALTGQPLIDERVQAWKFGPVISSVYHFFKGYGNRQIDSTVSLIETESLPTHTKQLLDKIWEVYGNMNGLQLSTLTHQPNTPWDIVWNQQGGKDGVSVSIPNDLIKEHYKLKANAGAASTY
jgi:uncharacterized phage-associated protein